jgi:hypothetical protein
MCEGDGRTKSEGQGRESLQCVQYGFHEFLRSANSDAQGGMSDSRIILRVIKPPPSANTICGGWRLSIRSEWSLTRVLVALAGSYAALHAHMIRHSAAASTHSPADQGAFTTAKEATYNRAAGR